MSEGDIDPKYWATKMTERKTAPDCAFCGTPMTLDGGTWVCSCGRGSKDANINCLKGMLCPKCGSLGTFTMSVHINAEVVMSDLGLVETNSQSTEWEDDDACGCNECNFQGTVKDFTVKNEGDGK